MNVNDDTVTKCEKCGWHGAFKDQAKKSTGGGSFDHVCPRCEHDTFTLPCERKGAVLVLQLKEGEDLSHGYAARASLVVSAEGTILKNRWGPLDLPWRVWEVNDLPEWILARTREEAVMGYLKHYENWHWVMEVEDACADFDNGLYDSLEEITPLEDNDLNRLRFKEDDEAEEWRTFPEELARRVAAGAQCELFATSEY